MDESETNEPYSSALSYDDYRMIEDEVQRLNEHKDPDRRILLPQELSNLFRGVK